MAPADHTYRVRPASAADLPAVLTILTENQAGPSLPVPAAGRPSDRQKAAWERVLATADLTVYLAETGAEAAGAASMLLMPRITRPGRADHPSEPLDEVTSAPSASPARLFARQCDNHDFYRVDSGLRVVFGYHGAQKSPRSPDPPGSFAAACLTVHIRTGHPGNTAWACNPIRSYSSRPLAMPGQTRSSRQPGSGRQTAFRPH
jgi:hypothetical protein